MTPEQYTEWRKKMGFTHEQAAKELGISERLSYYYASGKRSVGKRTEIACKALLEEKQA